MAGYPDTEGSSDETFDAWLPKFAISYKGLENVMPYLSLSRGFKSGGFNLKSGAGQSYDSEFNWAYEAGLKTNWLGNRLHADLAFFLTKWDDLQVEQPDYPDYTVVNAAAVTSYGAELEIRALPLRHLELTGALGYTHAEFDDFELDGQKLRGFTVPNVPNFSAQLGGTYRFDNGVFLNADYIRTGSRYADAKNDCVLGAYQTVNAKIGYEWENYDVYLWGKNLFDETYVTRAFSMGNDWYGRAGNPLTFGLSADIRF
jgi:iron complex outermembrane receptor protein